ncbi:MAG: type II secretion system protein GspK [Gammaproteobacteria bacterium]|nr:type II secretion system protein GspK [Gammaproteobacteria bacterium]
MNCRQRGVALVQVLLVTAIIILLVMQLSLTAAEQVRRAQALQDRSVAELYLHSREVALLYTLLTEPLLALPGSSNPYAASWNFRGEAFLVDGLQITLQDQSGLMRFPILGVTEFEQLLTVLGLGPTKAREMAARLARWIGIIPAGGSGPGDAMMRNGTGAPVQYFGELRFLAGMDEQLYRKLSELMTFYPTPGFNPLTAPAPLLRMRMPESTLEAVLDARRNGELDDDRLWRMSGIGADESILPFAGPGIGIRLAGEYRGVTLRRHLVVGVLPYSGEPLLLWSRERFASGIPK